MQTHRYHTPSVVAEKPLTDSIALAHFLKFCSKIVLKITTEKNFFSNKISKISEIIEYEKLFHLSYEWPRSDEQESRKQVFKN